MECARRSRYLRVSYKGSGLQPLLVVVHRQSRKTLCGSEHCHGHLLVPETEERYMLSSTDVRLSQTGMTGDVLDKGDGMVRSHTAAKNSTDIENYPILSNGGAEVALWHIVSIKMAEVAP